MCNRGGGAVNTVTQITTDCTDYAHFQGKFSSVAHISISVISEIPVISVINTDLERFQRFLRGSGDFFSVF